MPKSPRITTVRFHVPESTWQDVVVGVALAHERQSKAGIDKDGKPIVGKSGKRLDLTDSGEMWATRRTTPKGLEFPAGHAGMVLTKYNATGLAPDIQAQTEKALAPMLAREVTGKEE